MEEKKNKINKTKISVVLGIMCFALALGICIQIRTVKNSNSTVSSNYEENNLRAEVLKYKEKYDNKYKELEKAEEELEKERQNSTKDNSQLEEKEEQIKQGNKMIGLTEVTGPGVIVTLSDSKKDANSVLNPSTLLVHDVDILGVVNELKNAGAEAISINDQRIVPTTSISCGGNIIDTIDPFVNIGALDFNLKTTSSAINAGNNQHWINNVGALTGAELDLGGNPRLVGTTIDIGAYENQL